ncbi:MAG: PspA/IM30 family protein [Oscillospiraceae bacterium]|jgi:phage shock protein A|nr:PspA/IM30 family protein [Oscillospiraceae bacterium]
MAGILTRAKDILASNVHALLDKCEDPAKMIDQLLREAKNNLAEVKKEAAQVMAQEDAARRQLEKERRDVVEYTKSAKAAIAAGNEADALKLAERIAKEELELSQAEKVYDMCKVNADNMKAVYKKLTADVQLLEGKRANLKGLAAASKAQETVNKTASRTTGGIGTKIDDMEQKIQQRFDAANAMASLDAEVGDEVSALVSKYSGAGAEDVLTRLKGEMGLSANDTGANARPEDPETILERLKTSD